MRPFGSQLKKKKFYAVCLRNRLITNLLSRHSAFIAIIERLTL
jgi:hypothetical protein